MAHIRGTHDKEKLVGTTLDDRMLGLGGDDTLIGGDGDDRLIGSHLEISVGAGDIRLYHVDSINDIEASDFIF